MVDTHKSEAGISPYRCLLYAAVALKYKSFYRENRDFLHTMQALDYQMDYDLEKTVEQTIYTGGALSDYLREQVLKVKR